MKRLLLILIMLSGLNAQSVVKVLDAPRRSGGLTFDGEHLYSGLYASGNDVFIFQIDTSNGAVIDTIPSPRDDCYGLAFDGEYIYFLHHYMGSDHHIYKLDTLGNLIDSFPTPRHYMAGLTYDGAHLWAAAYYDPDGRFYEIDPATGDTLRSLPAPDAQPWGLAFDGTNLWMVDYYANMVYAVDTASGQVVASFSSPGANPTGATWDGAYLWVTAKNPNSPTGWSFFQINVSGGGTPDIYIPDTLLDFGAVSVGDTATASLQIYNQGDTVLTIDSVEISGDGFFVSQTASPIASIEPGSSYGLPVHFYATATGEYRGTLSVFSNDPDEGRVDVSLHASSVLYGPHIVTSDTTMDFGENYVGGLKRMVLVVTDSGTSDLIIDSIRVSSANFYLEDIDFPITVRPLNSDSLTVFFSPEVEGEVNDTMWIYSNDAAAPSFPIALHGQAISPSAFTGGDLLWSVSGPDNVVSSTYFVDPRDSTPIVVFDSYDAGVTGDNLFAIRGNSYGEAIPLWTRDIGGGWGEGGLKAVSDLNGDGFPDIVHGSAWGDRTIYAISGLDGTVIWSYDTHREDGHGGWVYSVDTLGDVNGDGVPEVIAGVGGWNSGSMGPRCVYVFDGASGTVLFRHQANDAVITVAPIRDVNGDSYPDIIAGAGGNSVRDNHVYLVSGNPAENGRVIWSYDTGGDVWWVISIPDLNGDGVDDVIAGNWSGMVLAISGADGQLIWQNTVSSVVMKVVDIGDVSGDGLHDVAVGSWSSDVMVLSGSDGAILWRFYTGGDVWTVNSVDDLNGDGFNEVVAGSFDHKIYVLDGHTGDSLWSFAGDNKFFTVLAVSDVNGDGFADIGGGTQMLGSNGGTFYLLSGGAVPPSVNEGYADVGQTIITITPNVSADGMFTVKAPKASSVRVYDASGREVFSHAVVGNTLSFRLNSPGVYILLIDTGRSVRTQKIVVVR